MSSLLFQPPTWTLKLILTSWTWLTRGTVLSGVGEQAPNLQDLVLSLSILTGGAETRALGEPRTSRRQEMNTSLLFNFG